MRRTTFQLISRGRSVSMQKLSDEKQAATVGRNRQADRKIEADVPVIKSVTRI